MLQKIPERHTDLLCFLEKKTELIITTTNVCCLRLWVYVIISVFLYLFACKKQFACQTFGERTVYQSELILNALFLYALKL